MKSVESKSIVRRAGKLAAWRIVRRFSSGVPYAGTVIAIGLVGDSVRRKGMIRGVINSGLDAVPILGTVKNVTEFFLGDFIPDKSRRAMNDGEYAKEIAEIHEE